MILDGVLGGSSSSQHKLNDSELQLDQVPCLGYAKRAPVTLAHFVDPAAGLANFPVVLEFKESDWGLSPHTLVSTFSSR